jgi:hypothetical protein
VTIALVTQPTTTTRTFQFTTDVGASPFTLSDGTSQVFTYIVDGSYQVTLAADQSAGYDVGVSCVGAGSPSTNGVQTTFDVIGSDVTCTFTLTGTVFATILCCIVVST